MLKLRKITFLACFILISVNTFAEDMVEYDGNPEQKVLYPVNGSSGFVLNRLNKVFKTSSQDYNLVILDSSTVPSNDQISKIKSYLDKGIAVVIDAKSGIGTAQSVAQKIVGFSVNAEAIIIQKSTEGGYDVTPVSSTVYGSKASGDGSDRVANTVDDVFGL